MIILDATTKSLQMKLGAAIATNQLPFAVSYVSSTGTVTTPTEQDGVSNGTTAVTIVSAPASSTQVLVKNIVIQNADTASAKVTVIYNNNSTLRNIVVATLAVGDQLIYEDGNGWSTIDTNGNFKTSGSGGGGGSGTVTTVSVASANGFTGTVANATTTPAITLATSITGILKGNGTAISAATAGADYQAPISLTTTGSSGAATFISNVLNIPQYSGGGAVSSVSNSDGTLTISPTTGNVVASLSQAGLQSYLPGGYVNKFRNGTMDIWQRGTSGTVTTGNANYTADGWIVGATGATVSWAQSTTLQSDIGTYYALQLTGASSMTDTFVRQRIESYVMAPFASKVVTVQFYVYNGLASGSLTPTLTVKHPTAQDNYTSTTTDVSAVSLQTISNGTGAVVAYTFTASSSYNGMEITLDFGSALSSGSNNIYISIADIRVTPGLSTGQNNTPPVAELRPVGPEMAFCQRYYTNTYGNGVGVAAATRYGMISTGYSTTSVGYGFSVQFPVQMRAAPTIAYYDGAGNSNKLSVFQTDGIYDDISVAGGSIYAIGITGFMSLLYNASVPTSAFHYTATAEL